MDSVTGMQIQEAVHVKIQRFIALIGQQYFAHIYEKKFVSLQHLVISHIFAHYLIFCFPITLITNGHILKYFWFV